MSSVRMLFFKRKHAVRPLSAPMFNLYQTVNKKEQDEKESNVIGHERWYQERVGRSSLKRKKRPPRRAQSAAEFSPQTLNAASRRAAFRTRSQSSENKEMDGNSGSSKSSPNLTDSFAKLLFTKRSASTQKHEYSALKTDGGCEKYRLEKQAKSGAFLALKQYLADNDRYELNSQLCNIGSRVDRHWFTVLDNVLGAERLLILLQLPSTCPILPNENNKRNLLELFRGLQHPYIHPILDIEFWEAGTALIMPLNPDGSLRDLIYGAPWREDYSEKYHARGHGLPLKTIQCLGRQILEGLLFLRSRDFPPFHHLHSGNVIIQNGVARIASLENTLFGLPPKPPSPFESIAFAYLLFEMAAGYELAGPPSQAHLQLELERLPRVADTIDQIFQSPRPPGLEEVLCSELFRGVELRELRGATIIQNRMSPDVQELLEAVRNPVPPSPVRRLQVHMFRSKKKSKYICLYY
ncbi:slowpoke-binding protein isoform X3 [Coccinella septempunctata]|uniref:slowpoke-binding protein isoform X3 n=1 Tax=Coccinella septempunctata TaxID=41139 RepID=UPI001D072B5E|nr:slowpoke-binding protein isoform X3 [Coccinella septempunctata]